MSVKPKIVIDYRSVKLTSRHLDVFALAELLSKSTPVDILCSGVESALAPTPGQSLRYIVLDRHKKLTKLAASNSRKMSSFYRWAGQGNDLTNRARRQIDFLENLTATTTSKIILGSRSARVYYSKYAYKAILWVHSKSDLRDRSSSTSIPAMSTRFGLRLPKFHDLTWAPQWGLGRLNKINRVHTRARDHLVVISGASPVKVRSHSLAVALYHSIKDADPNIRVCLLDTPNSPNYENKLMLMTKCKVWIDLSFDGQFLIPFTAAKIGAVVYSNNPWAQSWAPPIDANPRHFLEDVLETMNDHARATRLLNTTLNQMRAIDVKAATNRVKEFIMGR
jgi:hypothetical protein